MECHCGTTLLLMSGCTQGIWTVVLQMPGDHWKQSISPGLEVTRWRAHAIAGGSSDRDDTPNMRTHKLLYTPRLVVWNMNSIFPYIGNVIIPIDYIIFFRGVAQPPTSSTLSWNVSKNITVSLGTMIPAASKTCQVIVTGRQQQGAKIKNLHHHPTRQRNLWTRQLVDWTWLISALCFQYLSVIWPIWNAIHKDGF